MPHFETMKLPALRSLARDLNIPVADIREHGDLRHRQTWIDAIASAITRLTTETADTMPVSEDSATTETATTSSQNVSNSEHMPKMGTSSQLDTKCEVIGFVDGQLLLHTGLSQAQKVAALVEAGRWAEAFQIIHYNPTATRILQRIQELHQLRGVAA